ncbi:MAG: amino acid ABC transporter substrate-binding protein [Thermodesulfovibrionales bacterium]|nr:amino acid ABC transporter substrate-binding protein [Thermodesulfovibrionales bacterium]
MQKIHLLVLYILISCLLCMNAYGSEPIKIGVSLSLTGIYSPMGNYQKNGFQLWEKHINEKGGLLNREVKIIIHDDKSNPEIAKAIYAQMILEEKVDFLFGPYSTPITNAILPLAEKYNYPLLISGAAGDSLWEQNFKNAIGVYTPTSKIPYSFLEMLLNHDIRKLAIFYSDDQFSRDLANAFLANVNKYNLKISLVESFKKDSKDLKYLAKKTKESSVEALILAGHFQEAVNMRKALKAIKYYPKVFYAHIGASIDAYRRELGDDANLTFASSLWEVEANFPNSKKFYEDYLKNFKELPQYHSALAYATGQVFEEAVKRVNSLDKEKLREAFFKMDIIIIIGRYSIDKTGKQKRQQVFVTQWQKGTKKIVWPPNFSNSKPIIFK